MKNTYAYVGTMGRTDGRPSAFNGKGGGIYAFQFDTSTGKLTPINMSVGIETTMVSLSPNKNVLYSSNECRDFGACVDTDLGITPYGTYAGTGGGISAYALNCKTGEISFINSDLSRGGCTAYSTVSKSGKYVLVANHASHVDAVCAYVPNGKGGFDLKRTFDSPSVAVYMTIPSVSFGERIILPFSVHFFSPPKSPQYIFRQVDHFFITMTILYGYF